MGKYNILLVINNGATGLSYHRQLVPHSYLAFNDPEFTFTRCESIDQLNFEQLKEFCAVCFLREIDSTWTGKSRYTIERLKKLGINIIFDIDDYWKIDKTNNQSKFYRENKVPQQVEEIIKLVDHVTTTTEHLANLIRPLNRNVNVLCNSINPEETQFQIRNIENARVRFGWIGGVHHRPDLELMRHSLAKMYDDKTIIDKFQLCLGGFNVTTPFTDQDEIDLKKLGVDVERAKQMNFRQLCDYFISKRINVPVPEYTVLERIFSNEYKTIKKDKQYFEYLTQFTQAAEHISFDKSYRRLWGKDVFNYGSMYNEIDVALVPLFDNEFNRCKSQLKIIEAGFMKKSVIVSEVHPYTIDCVNRVNCLTVRPNMNLLDWFLHMKRLINEPNLRQDLAESMHDTVKEKYHVKTQNEIRKDLYKKICE